SSRTSSRRESARRPPPVELRVRGSDPVAEQQRQAPAIAEEDSRAEEEIDAGERDQHGTVRGWRSGRSQDELRPEQAEQRPRLPDGDRQAREGGDREHGLRGGQEELRP